MVEAPDERRVLLDDEGRCYTALRCDGDTFTDSWDRLEADRPAKRATRLGSVGAVVELLDEMGPTLGTAYEALKEHQRRRALAKQGEAEAMLQEDHDRRDCIPGTGA